MRMNYQRDSVAEASRRVLVVDHDPAIVDIITQTLAAEGYEVQVASNGAEAFQRLHKSPPMLILLDLWMPKMNGWEFRSRQLELPVICDIPVVLLSAGGNLDEHARNLEAAGMIAKPFDLSSLLNTVGGIVARLPS